MAEFVRFVDGPQWTEQDMAEVLARFGRTGLIWGSSPGTAGTELQVTAPGGMVVNVAAGEAFLQGLWYKNDASKALAIGANASGSTRIDSVVVHLDPSANTCVAQIKVGTPGAGAPGLTQIPFGVWEIRLANVTVVNGAVSVAGQVADTRTYSLQVLSQNELASNIIGGVNIIAAAVDTPNLALNAATKNWGILSLNTAATASATYVALMNFTVTVPAGVTSSFVIAVTGCGRFSVNGAIGAFAFQLDGGAINVMTAFQCGPGAATYDHSFAGVGTVSAGPGSHTITLLWLVVSGGTLTLDNAETWLEEFRR